MKQEQQKHTALAICKKELEMSMRAFNFLKKAWTFYIFSWYSFLNKIAIATMTKLPRNQSIRDLQ